MNTTEIIERSHRILVIDDNPAIHEDIRKILCPAADTWDLDQDEAAIFGQAAAMAEVSPFLIDSAYQGQEGLALVEKALAEKRPYSMAFVDVRMPPGWDGVETIQHIWKSYPDLQVVICTAYSDHSWAEIIKTLGKSDSLLILKKPFDNVEVLQLAHALSKKWVMTCQAKFRLENLEAVVERRTFELVRANEKLQAEVKRRAEVETELRESEERFRKSFETALVALAIFKADTLAHLEVNTSFVELTGYARADLVGKSPRDLGLPEKFAEFDEMIKRIRTGEPIHNLELNICRADHQVRQTLISIVSINLDNKPCFLAAMLDVSDQRRLEAQLRQSQKMEAIGQLAGGVAHDFNNLLTIILGHASILLAKAKVDGNVSESLQEVKQAGERAASLTRQLLAFSRKQVLQRAPLNLADTVKKTEGMLKSILGELIQVEAVFDEKVPPVLADETNIEQVLLNLAVNARDAMPDGGKITIRVVEQTIRSFTFKRHDEARDGRFVLLAVTDTGCGMDAETQRRLFEPFFTTKAMGKGTGLGLSTVYGIVKQHEGWIEVESAPGVGSTFRVFLPVTDRKPKVIIDIPAPASPAPRQECILVVEDEPEVRSIVCKALRGHGYGVLDADCGQKAIEVWDKAESRIDLLLTDMVMPDGINGGALARTLLKRKEGLKVVFMSGYSAELTNNGDLLNDRNFLPKPFSLEKLIDTVGRAIRGTDGRAENSARSCAFLSASPPGLK